MATVGFPFLCSRRQRPTTSFKRLVALSSSSPSSFRLSSFCSLPTTVLSFLYILTFFARTIALCFTAQHIIMDRNAHSINTHTDDFNVDDKRKLDSFRLGSAAPHSVNRRSAPIPHHARSHSRKDSSISSIPSVISLPYVSPASFTDTSPTSPNANNSSKRNSHHRRRSSVSTRHESAEIMGVTLPSIPLSVSDDNINLGDKDSIRRRALLTLEGKTDVGSFSKVEIPELSAGEIKKSFDFRMYHLSCFPI